MKNSKKNQIRMSRSDILFHIIFYILFSIITLVCFYPFYYLLICTVSDNTQVALDNVYLYPIGLHFDNYIQIFQVQDLFRAFAVSLARVFIGTGTSLYVTAYLAYFFTKQEMWARKFWYRFAVITMYFSAGMIPIYLNLRMLGLLNSFWVYVLPGLVNVYDMVLIKTSMESIPLDLEESAVLDGAGYYKRFTRIVLPLQKPILATVALFMAVHHWNDFFTTKLYITKPELYTLQFKLYELLNQITSAADQINNDDRYATITPLGIRLTLTAVVTIPILMVYPFVQRYYVKGIMIGAVKG